MKMRKQRFLGFVLILISFVLIALAMAGTTPEEQDITMVLITFPLGIYAMVTKENILYDGGEESARQSTKPTKKGARTWQENESSKPLRSSPGKTLTQPSVRSRRPS